VVDDDDAFNLNKMMINFLFIVALMYHISVKLHLCKDVCQD